MKLKLSSGDERVAFTLIEIMIVVVLTALVLTCPINPEFSRTSGGARAPGSYRTSSEASVGEQLCLAGAGVHLPYHVFISQAGIL